MHTSEKVKMKGENAQHKKNASTSEDRTMPTLVPVIVKEEFPPDFIGFTKKCLICSEDTLYFQSSDDIAGDVELVCLLLKVKCPSFETNEVDTLCASCTTIVGEVKFVFEELEKLNNSVEDYRKILNDKLTFREEGSNLVIRGRKRKEQDNVATETPKKEDDQPDQIIQSTWTSKRGRVIKKPKFMDDDIDDNVPSKSSKIDKIKKPEMILKSDPTFENEDEANFLDSEWDIVQETEDENDETENPSSEDETDLSDKPKRKSFSKKAVNKKSESSNTGKSKINNKNKEKPNKKKNFEEIPIKIRAANGEEFEGIYQKIENQENKVPDEQTKEKIEAGSVISINSDILGIRIKCTEKDCLKHFRYMNTMNIHVKKVHLGIAEPFECPECKKTFRAMCFLRTHAKEHGPIPDWLKKSDKSYSCEVENCSYKTRNPGELKVHQRVHHTHETPYPCGIGTCVKSFVSINHKERHVEKFHPEAAHLKCDQCPKAFFRQHRLRDHLKSHTGERSYLCEICSKSFSQPSYLRYHQTKHVELNLPAYNCDLCERVFASPVNLKLHKNTQHEQIFRYRCDICNHGASHRSHLKLHMRTHTGERPHPCPICPKTYSRAAQLTIHIRSHTGDRPYVCADKTCCKTFTNSSKLKRHELIHSQAKAFVCDVCGKNFRQIYNLNVHIKSAHKPKPKRKKVEPEEDSPEEEEEASEPPTITTTPAILQPQIQFTTHHIPIQVQVQVSGESEEYTDFIFLNPI